MSEMMENWVNEETERARMQTKEEIAVAMIKDGELSLEKIAEYAQIPVDRVQELAGERTA